MTRACLKVVGKDPSDNDRLTIMVIGLMSTSKQDLRRLVRITSRMRWLRHLERKSVDDWKSSCRSVDDWKSACRSVDDWKSACRSVDDWKSACRSVDDWKSACKSVDDWKSACRSVDDWKSACRSVEVAGVRCEGRYRKTERICEG